MMLKLKYYSDNPTQLKIDLDTHSNSEESHMEIELEE